MSEQRIYGKWVVLSFVLVAVILGATLALVFRNASLFKGEVVEKIRTEFMAYATQIHISKKLQLAELNQIEVFSRESAGKLWNFDLPTVVVSITAPVTYVYVVDLQKKWQFRLEDDVLIVVAPALEWNAPAPDLSATRFEVKKGSVFRDEASVLQSLRDEFTPLLQVRAEANVQLVRETARSSLQDIILNWMKTQNQNAKDPKIKVMFTDEKDSVR